MLGGSTRADGAEQAGGEVAAFGWLLNQDRDDLKEQIKAANDIVDVVGSYISLRPAGPTFKGLCPFHDDSRPSFDVDPRRQRYRCWACSKYGDVISFVQEYERVGFPEALELLARRAGISLEKHGFSQQSGQRARMLDAVRWAAEHFKDCLLDSPLGETARKYLGERRLVGEVVRRFGLGFAPAGGDWLVQKALQAGHPLELLEQVGLIAKRNEGSGYYDRFRDRVIFPIRDIRGQTVGFGGRVLPGSPLAERGPKYYNSAETLLFSKSDQLFGIDLARNAAAKQGWLAIVEGYTDVMMAHQHGIENVVATMGTALNDRHIKKLRHVVGRVVLVFDADEGGMTGVDRALEVFVRENLELRVASLPDGLDPCDLLVERGPAPFVEALEGATDVFEFKLDRVWRQASEGIESQRRALEQMLNVLSNAPDLKSVKMELMVNRIAHRLGLKEETLWSRLRELHRKKHSPEETRGQPEPDSAATANRAAPAARHEVDLLMVLLGDPSLVAKVQPEVSPSDLEHAGLRLLLEGLYRLQAEGTVPKLEHLRGRIDNPALMSKALDLQDRGAVLADKATCLQNVLARFQEREQKRRAREIQGQLKSAESHERGIEGLEQLMKSSGR